MNFSHPAPPARSPFKKCVLRYGGLVSAIGLLSFPLYHAEAKARQETELAQKSTRYCAILLKACDTLTFAKDWHGTAKIDGKTRRGWEVDCKAGKRSLALQFDEKTLELCGVFCEDPNLFTFQGSVRETLKTDMQATEASISRLRQLDLLREGYQYALREKPGRTLKGRAWRVEWKVRNKVTGEVRFLNTVIDAASELPIMIYEPLREEERIAR